MATTQSSTEARPTAPPANGVAGPRDEQDDYERDQEGSEYVDDRWVEKNVGAEASLVAVNLTVRLGGFCQEHELGFLLDGDTGYHKIFPSQSKTVRKPDRSFVRAGRLPGGKVPKGYIDIAPDLAVEVISPNDEYGEVQQKKLDYLSAGVKLVWIIDPPSKSVTVVRADRSGHELILGDELDGEDVVPGFRMTLADLLAGV